MKDNSTGE